MTAPLPKLLDVKGVMEELGVARATAENLMRSVATIRVGRRVFVKREDLQAELERRAAA